MNLMKWRLKLGRYFFRMAMARINRLIRLNQIKGAQGGGVTQTPPRFEKSGKTPPRIEVEDPPPLSRRAKRGGLYFGFLTTLTNVVYGFDFAYPLTRPPTHPHPPPEKFQRELARLGIFSMIFQLKSLEKGIFLMIF